MALNPQAIASNLGTRAVKTPAIRLSDAAARTTTAYAELLTGTGAPSGGYGRDSSATMLYARQDASSAATSFYVTANGGTTWTALAPVGSTITDPGNAGAIPVTAPGCVPIVTAGAETRTLAVPSYVGQTLTLYFQTDGGDCVVTVAAAINATGNNTITLNDANDSIVLVGVYNGSALRWRVLLNDGCALSTV